MLETGKRIAVTVTCIILMCLAVVAAMLYAEGYYDISFIDRPNEETYPPQQTNPSEDTTQTSPKEDEKPKEELEIPNAQVYFQGGYTVYNGLYDSKRCVIAKLPLKFAEPYEFSTVKKPQSVKISGTDVFRRYENKTEQLPLYSAELYMGYIIASDANGTVVYNPDGTVALERFYGWFDELPYERNADGKAVFVKNGEKYVIENGSLVNAGECLDIGVNFNYSTSYGDGADIYDAEANEYYQVPRRDIYALGQAYIDGGLVMVRNIKEHKGKVIEDREILVNAKTNKEYSLPGIYDLISYSNLRMLLMKNGKYGFYAIKGDWITDMNTYTYAKPYCEGLAVVGIDGKMGVIDLNGNIVLPMEYTHITECCEGVFLAYSQENGWEAFVKLSSERRN